MKYLQLATLGQRSYLRYVITLTGVISIFIVVGQLSYATGMSLVGVPTAELANYSLDQSRELMGNNLFFIINLLPFVALFFALLLAIKYIHQRPIWSIFSSRNTFDWKRFFLSFSLFGLVLGVGLFYVIQTSENIQWNYQKDTFWMLLGISCFILPIQTAVEELLFRGYMMQGSINIFKKPIIAAIVSSFVFAGLHMGNPEVEKLGTQILLYYFSCGLFMALLTILDDGLELSLGFHTVNNIFGALMVTNHWQVFQTDALFMDTSKPVIGIDLWIIVLVFFPMLLLIYHKVYKWKSWKKALFEPIDLGNSGQTEEGKEVSEN
jgi:membrane protease YdiL (CAAX protease family)